MTEALDAQGPNREQIAYWNGDTGDKWVEAQERLDPVLEIFSDAAMDAVGVGPGERVIDIGCGCGATTLSLARRVGPIGSVMGVDISTRMLQRAAERADAAGLRNTGFVNADASTCLFEEGAADLLFSRFGVMFFPDPAPAFANMRKGLKPGGRLGFVCWAPLARNEWVTMPRDIALRHVPPPEPVDPHAPGPFAFADPDRVRGILDDAGFSKIEVTAHDTTMRQPGTIDEVTRFVTHFGPASRLLNDVDEATRTAVEDDVRVAIASLHDGSGVDLEAAMWIVTARA
ncbi:MAG: methyltransferase domain-containing protein [Rhodospirillales bacterium]|nr:methyltransferase domain-containing protein [Rhodospirillales bacterium]